MSLLALINLFNSTIYVCGRILVHSILDKLQRVYNWRPWGDCHGGQSWSLGRPRHLHRSRGAEEVSTGRPWGENIERAVEWRSAASCNLPVEFWSVFIPPLELNRVDCVSGVKSALVELRSTISLLKTSWMFPTSSMIVNSSRVVSWIAGNFSCNLT